MVIATSAYKLELNCQHLMDLPSEFSNIKLIQVTLLKILLTVSGL